MLQINADKKLRKHVWFVPHLFKMRPFVDIAGSFIAGSHVNYEKERIV